MSMLVPVKYSYTQIGAQMIPKFHRIYDSLYLVLNLHIHSIEAATIILVYQCSFIHTTKVIHEFTVKNDTLFYYFYPHIKMCPSEKRRLSSSKSKNV